MWELSSYVGIIYYYYLNKNAHPGSHDMNWIDFVNKIVTNMKFVTKEMNSASGLVQILRNE